MSVTIIFLDIDGVLNDHTADPIAESATLLPRCVEQLNRIIDATDCRIVLVSAWRYMVSNAAITLHGFEYLLRTHLIHAKGRLIGMTRSDWESSGIQSSERGRQVQEWLDQHHASGIGRYVAIDDLDLGYSEFGIPLVDTDGRVGLTEVEADKVIAILCPPVGNDDDTAEMLICVDCDGEFEDDGTGSIICEDCHYGDETEGK